jgi:ABC-type uncharacterized transport system auxiliary subunit
MGKRVTLAAGCMAALLLAGCGDETKTVDHTTLEKAIEISVARQRHEVVIVACPKDIEQKKGKRFNCTATRASGEQVKFRVTVKDDKGNLRYAGLKTKSK